MTLPSIVIRPPGPKVDNIAEFKEFWKFRHLLFVLVERGIRSRYKNSVLGVAWSMLIPLMSVVVLTIFVGFIMNTGPKSVSAYIFCTILPWTFFQTAVQDSSIAVILSLGLLKKVYLPREMPILSAVFQNFVQFLIGLGIFFLYRWGATTLLLGWPGWPPVQILYLPVILLVMLLSTIGFAFFIGAANVFYEDIRYVMTLLLSLGFYLMPIIYPAEKIYYAPRVPAHVAHLAYYVYLLNPITWVVESFRQIFFGRYNMASPGLPVQMTAPFDPRYMAIAGIESLLFCYLGYAFFNRYKWKFTERP